MREQMQTRDETFNLSRFFGPLLCSTQLPTTAAPDMRAFLVTSLLLTVISGCRCVPPEATSITLRVKNGGRDPIFLKDTSGQLGLTVQRNVNGEWFSFDDQPCPCRSCEQACDRVCSCPDAGGVDVIRQVAPNGQAERTWSGVVQVAGIACNQVCLSPENAPSDETLQLRLCFVNQLDGLATGDGGTVSGAFPRDDLQTCVTRKFQPNQGVVEIGPQRGADCVTRADCKGPGELCLDGSCTAGCPANTFPPQPELVVAFGDMGFFSTTTTPDAGRTVSTGTGKITATQFIGETLQISLSSPSGTGRVETRLPGGRSGPSLALNTDVRVAVVVRKRGSQVVRAVTVRETSSGQLLFAADTAIGEPVLDAADLAPFSVAVEPEPIGCRVDPTCGKLVSSKVALVSGAKKVVAEPGVTSLLTTVDGVWRFWNVTAGDYPADSDCTSFRPYALWREAR